MTMSKSKPDLSHLSYLDIVEASAECGEELRTETDGVLIHALRREYQTLADEHKKRIGQ
jgi:hypothetical protein